MLLTFELRHKSNNLSCWILLLICPPHITFTKMEESIEKSSTKQVSVKWGLIAAVVSIVFFMILTLTETDTSPWAGWIGLIPFIIIVVLAHKEFKEGGDGYMSYSKGLAIGTLVSLVSAVISSIFRYIYIKFIDEGYFARIEEQTILRLEEQGLSDSEIEQALEISSNFTNPEISLVLGIIGGVFFGFVLSLIITAFTKNSNPEDV